jgi:hypothetical protein
MADNLVYEESLNTEVDQSEFISKKWVYVNDNNSQNYTSQVVIDSTPLSNAGGWISWSEGYILMPLVVQLTGANLPAGAKGEYSWAFKSGFWQMINSMTVEFNNQNVIQQTPFLNVFRSFKASTSWSQDDLKNEGSTTGFYPDSSNSWSFCNQFSACTVAGTPAIRQSYSNARGFNFPYTNNASSDVATNIASIPAGVAYTNTAAIVAALGYPTLPITSVAGVPQSIVGGNPAGLTSAAPIQYTGTGSATPLFEGASNYGMLVRQRWNNYFSDSSNFNATLGQNLVNPTSACNTNYRTAMISSVAGSTTWTVYAKLRLKDLADYFEQMPLLKGATMRFYINTNQAIINFTVASGTITSADTGASSTVYPTLTVNNAPTIIGGLTCPLMLASAGFGQGNSTLPSGDYNLSVSIVKNTFSAQAGVAGAIYQTALTSCRLYAPVYTMNPLSESRYLSLAPTKKIMYKDIFQYQFNNISTGNFNFLVSNGISNIVSVLVVPFFSTNTTFVPSTNATITTGGTAPGTVSTLPYSTLLSPLTTSGATPDPIMITNFNILVSGVNLFLNNENYDFEAFKQQLAYSNQLNGGLTTGLSSGLISEDDFSNLYRYYYGDCSRILPSEQGVSRSVQIVGNISSQGTIGQTIGVSLMVFVEFMKEMTIDISTGARIE